MRGLSNKVAIVTGAAAGIGRAIAERLAREGASVAVADVNGEGATRVSAALGAEGWSAFALCLDVTNEQAVMDGVRKTIERFDRLDILVNCAAAFVMKGLEATTDEWFRVLSTNVIGCAVCAKHAVPHMRRQRSGAIVNICSISAVVAQPSFLTYSASKGALLTMTKCMALDLASDGIRVNAVSPGTVWTEGNADFIGRTYGLQREQADRHPEIGGQHLLARTADPEEIASVVAFLASDESSFVTGENIMADGGYTVR